MAIQSAINNMLGTAGTVAAISEHLGNQKKELNVKKLEAEKEIFNTENSLKENTENLVHTMMEKGKDDLILPKEGETPAEAESRGVDEYLEEKSELAENKYQDVMMSVKHPEKSKRVLAARMAAISVQDEIDARRNLKFDLDIAKEKYKALGGKM